MVTILATIIVLGIAAVLGIMSILSLAVAATDKFSWFHAFVWTMFATLVYAMVRV
jgi:hypothetical protein